MTKTLFINAKFEGKIELNGEVLKFFKENNVKSVALFASVQFLDLDKVIAQLKENGIKVLITKADRASEKMQILGCDVYENSFNEKIIQSSDFVLYIGDGKFHPNALIYAQINSNKIVSILVYNPISRQMKVIDEKEIFYNINKMKINIKKFLIAQKIGIIVSTKQGQMFIEDAEKLKQKLEKRGKKAFVFLDNNINLNELENFNFINAWVNTACPRLGLDDITSINSTVVNIRDVETF